VGCIARCGREKEEGKLSCAVLVKSEGRRVKTQRSRNVAV
jgi:hypothetical protein